MRKAILSALLITLSFYTVFAQEESICRVGINYEISKNKNWGTNLPVITKVAPYSPAELAGLKQNDIITAIEGLSTRSLSTEEIEQLLNPENKNEVMLTIHNIGRANKTVMLKKDCKMINAITEEQLSTAFSMYSLESNSERSFVCPFKITVTEDTIKFDNFKTFAFSAIDENNRDLETNINEYIEKELTQKGMTVDIDNPDILIQTFYFFDKNPNFMGRNKIVLNSPKTFRYDFRQNKMVKLPFMSPMASDTEAEYILQFGFRLIDQKKVPGRTLWECEANELMENSFSLDKYARIHVPLMCLQYPYVKSKKNTRFTLTQKTYNYTGISYDIDQLSSVTNVDTNSPAQAAGIQTGDQIISINKLSMKYTAEEFSAAYKGFITNTFKYRDSKTQFTDANGFDRCMYWDTFKYPQVAESLHKSGNRGAFSYLFYYAPYINPTGNNVCSFVILRDEEKQEIIVRPSIRRCVNIIVK